MLRPFFAFAMFLLLSSLAAADDEPLFSRISEKSLTKIFDDEKIEWERRETEKDGKKSVLYLLKFRNKLKSTLVNHGATLSILSLGFKTTKNEEISLERINEWNLRNWGYRTGIINKEGFANVGNVHNMKAGTNQKLIAQWLSDFEYSVGEFERFTR